MSGVVLENRHASARQRCFQGGTRAERRSDEGESGADGSTPSAETLEGEGGFATINDNGTPGVLLLLLLPPLLLLVCERFGLLRGRER